jgi:hypothetical protein
MVAMSKSAASNSAESNSAASNSGPLNDSPAPPTERDLQLYEAVAVVGLSSRTAAAVFGISQTRVLQVRQRMEEWIGRYVPRSVETLSPRERLIVAADLADRRSQMLFSEAMNAWRASQDAARERCTAGDRHAGPSQGDPRYLAMAMRTNLHMLQVAGMAQRYLAKLEEEAAGAAQAAGTSDAPTAVAADESDADTNPLVRDCSPAAAEQAAAAAELASGNFASADEPAGYDEQEARRRAFLAAVEAETAPVQPPRTDANGMLLEEEAGKAWTADSAQSEASEAAVATLAPPRRRLNRQERKARQRLFERKRRKA